MQNDDMRKLSKKLGFRLIEPSGTGFVIGGQNAHSRAPTSQNNQSQDPETDGNLERDYVRQKRKQLRTLRVPTNR